MEEVLFPRRAAFTNAEKIIVMVYFNGSNTALGVSSVYIHHECFFVMGK